MSSTILLSDANNEKLISDLQKTGEELAYDEAVAMVDYEKDADISPDSAKPIWEVYLDGTVETGELLHSSGIDDSSRFILDGKLSLEIGEPGSFSFTITPHHALYDSLTPYKSTVTVYQEGVELFRGRVTGFSTDIQRQRQVECEGDLTYLDDVYFPDTEISTTDRKLSDAFKYFISLYAKYAKLSPGDPRYLTGGDVSIAKAGYKIKMKKWFDHDDTDTATYTNIRSLIDNFSETFGGYFRTKRYPDGLVHVEYIAGYTDINDQPIVYGDNMIEFTIDSKMDELFTVLIPIGDSKGAEVGQLNKAATIATARTVTDRKVAGATLKHVAGGYWHNMELTWVEGVELYGRITKQETFAGVTGTGELLSRAMAYFRECITGHLGNYSIKFVDRHWLDPSYKPIYLGQKVRIISDLHGIDTKDRPMTCMKIEYDLVNPETVTAVFDLPFQPLTGSFTSKYKTKQKQQDTATKKAGGAAKAAQDDVDKANEEIAATQEENERLTRDLNIAKGDLAETSAALDKATKRLEYVEDKLGIRRRLQ